MLYPNLPSSLCILAHAIVYLTFYPPVCCFPFCLCISCLKFPHPFLLLLPKCWALKEEAACEVLVLNNSSWINLAFLLFWILLDSIYLFIYYYYYQVADVKKTIETAQGADIYPCSQQMLIHQGKVLKDTTTLEENQVAENSFIVIMLSKVIIYS